MRRMIRKTRATRSHCRSTRSRRTTNSVCCNPTIPCYGKGACEEIAKRRLIPAGARVTTAYGGGSVKKNGVYQEVLKYVTPVCEFGGRAEPTP